MKAPGKCDSLWALTHTIVSQSLEKRYPLNAIVKIRLLVRIWVVILSAPLPLHSFLSPKLITKVMISATPLQVQILGLWSTISKISSNICHIFDPQTLLGKRAFKWPVFSMMPDINCGTSKKSWAPFLAPNFTYRRSAPAICSSNGVVGEIAYFGVWKAILV